VNTKGVVGSLAIALIWIGASISTAAAAPAPLVLSQSTAFSFLGHSCGGIQEQSIATGFDPATGYPTGDVYIQTRCGGSGRGGGYHTTTYSAWVTVTWDFAGNTLSATRLTSSVTANPASTATDANGDTLYTTSNGSSVISASCSVVSTAGCNYRAYLTVPVPAAPTNVTATQVADQFQVAWQPATANSAVITSSTITASPVGSSAAILTATVSGAATTGSVGPLQPSTAYQISVVNTDPGGSSPPSNPISVTTLTASVTPSAPTNVAAHWTAPGSPNDTLVATWSAGAAGDSPTDQYQITIKGSDGGGTFTQTVSGSTPSATFAVSDVPDWSIQVRAHNAAGWGAWSTTAHLGGA
jgi:hypothetical protein